MKRRIIEIDENKCNGCGACAAACHEGAIAMVDGKARLMRDDYCDGLGDCLPTCPTGAITFVEREAAAYDEQAVMENKQRKMRKEGMTLPCGCPGSQSRNIQRQDASAVETPQAQQTSRLSQWPVQIKLVPVNAPYFDAHGCSLPPTAPLTPTPPSMSGLSRDTSPWWAAPSWTAWTIPKS